MACATGGRAFPVTGEAPTHVLGRATAAVAEAVDAGADSLAPEALKSARQHLAAATAEQQAKHEDRAGLFAREAIADAVFARAESERIMAERARTAAAGQLDQLTTGASASATGHP